jgi:hypothetical protein
MAAAGALAGGRSEKSLRFAAETLNRALEKRDTNTLNRLLSSRLQYGHSNGWIENREELKTHLYNGNLVYRRFERSGDEPRIVIEGITGLVRDEVRIEVLLDGRPLDMKLGVLQVWVFRKGEWQLIGRQSTKL